MFTIVQRVRVYMFSLARWGEPLKKGPIKSGHTLRLTWVIVGRLVLALWTGSVSRSEAGGVSGRGLTRRGAPPVNQIHFGSSQSAAPVSKRTYIIWALSFFAAPAIASDHCTDVDSRCTVYIVQCTVYGVRCTVYGVRCTVYGVRCTVYGVRCTVYNVRCTVYGVRCTVYGVRCTVYGVRCTVYGVRCTVYGVRCTVYGVRCTVYGVRCTVYGVRCTVYGVRCTVYGVRCTVYGVRCTVYGVRCTVYGVRCTVYGVRCTVYGVTANSIRYTMCTAYIVRRTNRSVRSSPLTRYSVPIRLLPPGGDTGNRLRHRNQLKRPMHYSWTDRTAMCSFIIGHLYLCPNNENGKHLYNGCLHLFINQSGQILFLHWFMNPALLYNNA